MQRLSNDSRHCSLCKEDRPAADFHSGGQTYCKPCRRLYDEGRHLKRRSLGFISPHAVVGQPPEHAGWYASDAPAYAPSIGATARLEAFVTVDAGSYRSTHVGARSWLLKHAHIGHDAIVGDDCLIATGAIVGGSAEIGSGGKLGLGAIVLPFRIVGEGATVGAGAVVTSNVAGGATVVGNPARVLDDAERNPLPHSER